jgi:thiamine biosynthesis lipoprotein ApbE
MTTAATLAKQPPTAAADWRALGTAVRLVVTDAGQLEAGRRLLAHELAVLDLACSRWRDDSELVLVERGAPAAVHVSAPLADAIGAALLAAELTDGDLDPTLALPAYLPAARPAPFPASDGRPGPKVTLRRQPTWRDIRLDATSGVLALPAGTRLDLGATAKARVADLAATRLADELDCGVLVSLGGDIAVAGPPPAGSWRVLIQEPAGLAGRYGQPARAATITMTAGGLATTSITTRQWRHGGVGLRHALDPRRGLRTSAPGGQGPDRDPTWRTASVLAGTALHASIASAAAIIRGPAAVGWLAGLGLPARLVASGGAVRTTGGWPAEGGRA